MIDSIEFCVYIRRMATRDELEPLRGALASALTGMAHRGSPQALQALWMSAAGAAAAQSSRPSAFESGTLVVDVDTPAWLSALQAQDSELRARLSASLPGFVRLALRLRGGTR